MVCQKHRNHNKKMHCVKIHSLFFYSSKNKVVKEIKKEERIIRNDTLILYNKNENIPSSFCCCFNSKPFLFSNQINCFSQDSLEQKRPGQVVTRPGHGSKKGAFRAKSKQKGPLFFLSIESFESLLDLNGIANKSCRYIIQIKTEKERFFQSLFHV